MKSFLLIVCVLTASISFSQTNKLNKELSLLIDSLKAQDQLPATIKSGESAQKAFQKVIHSNFPLVKKIADKYPIE